VNCFLSLLPLKKKKKAGRENIKGGEKKKREKGPPTSIHLSPFQGKKIMGEREGGGRKGK